MIDVIDRVPTYPGRVRLIPVAGQANTYDMVRADEPIVPGTPINRALFQAFIDELTAIRQQVDDKLFEISQRARVGDLTDGAIFGLYENGVLVPFLKISTSYRGITRTIVVRNNCIKADILTNPGENSYENCRTDVWLNTNYFPMLDSATQSVINAVNIKVSSNTISRKIFLLDYEEYTTTYLTYFLNQPARRIATLNGVPINHWTRGNQSVAYITTTGTVEYATASTFVAGIRPAFTLPPDFEVTVGDPSAANVMANAEVL